MERDINRQHSESLVSRITQERERFLSAWQQGAQYPELNEIRESIQKLNDLLWQTTMPPTYDKESSRSGGGYQRDQQSRVAPPNYGP